jgi:hypothetical protein
MRGGLNAGMRVFLCLQANSPLLPEGYTPAGPGTGNVDPR